MIYFKILAVAIALFILLRFVSSYFSVLSGKRKIRTAFLRVFPIVEMLSWLIYAFWAFGQLFKETPAYPVLTGSLILVVVVLFGWYFLRDFVSGIILKAENAFETGQQIHTANVSGTIKKLGYRSMEIVTGKGENVKVPFSLLIGQNIVKPADTGNWVGQVIRLNVSSGYRLEKIQNMLKTRILEMPWIISGEDIKIEVTRDESGNYTIEIHLHAINPEMAIKTEENLQVFIKEVFE